MNALSNANSVKDLRNSGSPPFWLSFAICLIISAVVSWLRLTIFQDRIFPLSTGLPLLLCLWNRDLRLLYGMALIFTVVSAIKIFWVMPSGLHERSYLSIVIGSQLINIWLVTGVIHGLIRAIEKITLKNHELNRANIEIEASNDELASSNEELAAREEEISRQNEELRAQAEELEQQSEELRQQAEETEQQSEELQALNMELMRKDKGLMTLLDSGRWLRSDLNESFVMNGICQAAVQVLGDAVQAAAVTECSDEALVLRGDFGFGLNGMHRSDLGCKKSFSSWLLKAGRIACIEDMGVRPDIRLPAPSTGPPFRAVLGAPIWMNGSSSGTLEVYSTNERQWTEYDFRIVEWLAAQAAVAQCAINAQLEVECKRRDAEEASRQKTRFLAAVSHDVRTPANAISLLAEFIEKSASDPEKYHRIPSLAKHLWENARALVDLVSGVLDITRLDSEAQELQIVDFPLADLVHSEMRQIQPQAESKGLRLLCDLPENETWLRTDQVRLGRVLSNLLCNAIKFTEIGEVKIICVFAETGDLMLHVTDTGIGIPSEHLGSVFDEFFQLRNPERNREKGTGLGLAICQRLLVGMGFGISVKSTLGIGSTFTVKIPAACVLMDRSEVDPSDASATPAAPNPLNGLSILLVEDHEVALETTAGLLAAEGAAVCKASNGRDAVRLLSSGTHELLLLDLNLPDFDGTEILMRLQQERPVSLRWILVVSGDVRPERADEVRQLGALSLIPKPVRIDRIREILHLQKNSPNTSGHWIPA